MKSNLRKLLTGLLMGVMLLGAIPAYAADPDITIIVEDITDEYEYIQQGEVAFQISAEGMPDKFTGAEIEVQIETNDMTFKKIDCNYDMQEAISNKISENGKLTMGIVNANKPVAASGTVELFKIIFKGGEPGQSTVKLTSVNLAESLVLGEQLERYTPKAVSPTEAVTATASAEGNTGVDAKITLQMDKVPSFDATKDNPISLKLTNSNGKKFTYNFNSYKTSGNTPTFEFNERLVADTYKVEISAFGYKTYVKNGVNIANALTITNADFMPGDVNGDEKIDFIDYTIFMSVFDNKLSTHTFLTDFDRNGTINYLDLNAIKASLAKEVTGK